MSEDHRPTHVLGREGELRALIPTRLALVGCGAHAYRNILPALCYVPEALVTTCCDVNLVKARLYANSQGAEASYYADVETMLEAEPIDAVLAVVGFDELTGQPRYPAVVEPILRRGIPVWMEKPPAANATGVAGMLAAARVGGTFAQVGFKKVYSPAVQRLKQLTGRDEFGAISQYTYSYEVDLPAQVGNLQTPSGRRFLDDFVHIASVIDFLIGTPALVQTVRGPSGSGFVVNQHGDGTIGTIALSPTRSRLAPVERLELIGNGASAVLESGAYLSYYPRAGRGPYGTSTSYLPPVTAADPPETGARFWEPDFSLGNLHGGSHFIQGYYHQLDQFVRSVRAATPPPNCDLHAAHRIMTYLDALVGPFEQWRTVPGRQPPRHRHEPDEPQTFACPRTGRALALKDGWNYVCRDCGRTRSARADDHFDCALAASDEHP
jgi:predicted dehydrogenase